MKIAGGVLSSCCCVAISSLCGRDSKRAPSDSEKAHLRVTVDFKEAEPLRGVSAASIAMIAPMQCTADGTSFVNMLQPPEYKDQELLSISLSGDRRVRAFHIETISHL